MPKFAYVKNGTVKYVQLVSSSTPAQDRWIALNRSGVVLKYSSNYDIMPGDLFVDDKFYKKDIETDATTLVEEADFGLPAVRFAGIMDGEVVGQWGEGKELFDSQEEINEFIDDVLTSEIVEVSKAEQFLVEKGWLYDGVDFINPDNV